MANCTNCGKPLKEGMKFCTSCGTAVKAGTAKSTAAKQETASQPAPVRPVANTSPTSPTSLVMSMTDEVITTLGWFGTLIVLVVPIVGLVLYFVWAFGSGGNLNRRNYCRAALIMMAISLGLSIIFGVMFAVMSESILTYFFGNIW